MGYSCEGSIIKDHRNSLFNVFLVSLCLIIGIVVVYIKVQNFDFVGYDDELYVTQNHYVQKGISLEGIKWAFTTFHSANWHPLTWLSHMLDCELYGLSPSGHHWTNVEFHIANTILLFFILFRMTGALWQSAFVAALFALHPLHVESVAWISERKDVLSTFFGLLCIAAYCRYVKKSCNISYLLVVLFFSLGLLAKPILVTFPFVLLLLDFWPLKRFQFHHDFHLKSKKPAADAIKRNYRIILEKVPLFILVVISCIVTYFAQKSEGTIKSIAALSLKSRIANAVVSYVSYVLKAIWPHNLAVFYPHPGNTLASWKVAGGALLIVAACCGAIRSAKKYPYIPVGLFLYLGTLVPVIGLVQVGDQAMADRYTYISLIGIFIIFSWGAADLLNKRHRSRKSEGRDQISEVRGQGTEILSGVTNPFNKSRFQKIFLGISAGTLLVALSWKTCFQLNSWKNAITLFEHAVSVTENNYQAQNNLGTAYGRSDLDKAIFHYKKVLEIKPNDEMAFYNLGSAYLEKGNIDEAVHHFLKALNIKPDYPAALNNLGEALVKKGDYDKAIYYFKAALKTESKKASAYINLANVLFLQARPDEAVSIYKEILQSNSENADVHYNLANILSSQNKIEEAVLHYKETLRIDPKYSKAYYNLGNIFLSQEKIRESYVHYNKAIQFNSNYVQAYNNSGVILCRLGKYDKARVFFLKAVQIDLNYSVAKKNLIIVNQALSSKGECFYLNHLTTTPDRSIIR